jgi:ankyrin repeat protein
VYPKINGFIFDKMRGFMKILSIFVLLSIISFSLHASKRLAEEDLSHESKRAAHEQLPSPEDLNQDLCEAIEQADLEKAKQCIDLGAELNTACHSQSMPTLFRMRPLCRAIYYEDIPMASLCIQRGASLCLSDEDGQSPLCTAVENQNVEMVKLLLKAIARGVAQEIAPLSRDEIIQLILTRLSPPTPERVVNLTHEGMVRLLFNAPMNVRNNEGDSALHLAVRDGNAQIVQLLLTAGMLGNYLDAHGATALHVAAQNGETLIARLLIGLGKVPCNTVDSNGSTPLHRVVVDHGDHVGVACLLIMRGASLMAQDNQGFTPRQRAELEGCEKLVALFDSSFSDFYHYPQQVLKNGCTQQELNQLLCYAAYAGLIDHVNLLIQHGADINYRDGDKSLLDFLVEGGSGHLVNALLKNPFFAKNFAKQHRLYKEQKRRGMLANQLTTLQSLTRDLLLDVVE